MNNLTADRVTARDVSLTEFVTLLVLELDQQKIRMPFQNEEKWHRLFYRFKREKDLPGRPSFLDSLRFDWDGRYPKAPDLSECLQTLHWNGFVSVANPSYDRLEVDQDVRKGANKLKPTIQDQCLNKFLKESSEAAKSIFG